MLILVVMLKNDGFYLDEIRMLCLHMFIKRDHVTLQLSTLLKTKLSEFVYLTNLMILLNLV